MTAGRHSAGRSGLARRDWAGSMPERGRRDAVRRRPRHRRAPSRPRATADGWAFLVAAAVLGMLAVSGWYTASGATAVAQMLAR